MRKIRMLAVGATALALLLSACQPGDGSSPSPSSGAPSTPAELPTVIVGSADFDESAIVAEIYAQALEAAGFSVERHLFFGTRETTLPALESGDLNLMPEYIGSLAEALGATSDADPAVTFSNLNAALTDRGLAAFNFSPGQDSDGLAVTAETAQEFDLATMSDIAPIADQFTWGLPPECAERPLCGIGLEAVYGIDVTAIPVENLPPCSTAMAEALNADAIQVARVCTTQAAIAQYNLVVLEDDQGLNPAQNLAPVVTEELAGAGGDLLESTLNAVSAELTTDELSELNLLVSVELQDLAEVAQAWLEDRGLI
ncbi:MAG TPA: ABC transporter substrate-binding protein [Pleomorphomonadaceae bacterium]|nr:ABC transporter substrate-binding protein [Pleomorphomonadaceae bacterium]